MKYIYCHLEETSAEQHLEALKRLESFGYRINYGTYTASSDEHDKWCTHYNLYSSCILKSDRSWFRVYFAELVVDAFVHHLDSTFGERLTIRIQDMPLYNQYISFIRICEDDEFLRFFCWSRLRGAKYNEIDDAFLLLYREVNPELEDEQGEDEPGENVE